MWLEMSRDEDHGGIGWEFSNYLWSPSRNKTNAKCAFRELLLQVKRGDIILHLKGTAHNACFVGYSIAYDNGYETLLRPPKPGKWGYAKSYYKVALTNFTPFSDPIKLDAVLQIKNKELTRYYLENKSKKKANKECLFYTLQSGRLRCLEGAYLSFLSNELAGIIFGPDFTGEDNIGRLAAISVQTGYQIRSIKTRIGQSAFSKNVQMNFRNECCFPACKIHEKEFLIGAHIARWADVPELQGGIENGLCFCLMHDKAFENGYFTLTSNFQIRLNDKLATLSDWAEENLLPFDGRYIKHCQVSPSLRALQYHWKRIGFKGAQ